jgi:hypothetical protein
MMTVYALQNPGNAVYVQTNPTDADWKYDALELVAQKRFSHNWHFMASYIRSKSRGLMNNTSPSATIGTNGIWANPNTRINAVTGLVKSALRVRKIYREDEKSALFDIENTTDIPVYLSGGPKGTPAKIKLTPHTLTWVRITKPVDMSDLTFTVDNFMCGESKRARIKLDPATATTR